MEEACFHKWNWHRCTVEWTSPFWSTIGVWPIRAVGLNYLPYLRGHSDIVDVDWSAKLSHRSHCHWSKDDIRLNRAIKHIPGWNVARSGISAGTLHCKGRNAVVEFTGPTAAQNGPIRCRRCPGGYDCGFGRGITGCPGLIVPCEAEIKNIPGA